MKRRSEADYWSHWILIWKVIRNFRQIYPERIWNVMRVNGTVYGLLNTWENFKQYYVFNENYLDKYDITVEDHMEMENIL